MSGNFLQGTQSAAFQRYYRDNFQRFYYTNPNGSSLIGTDYTRGTSQKGFLEAINAFNAQAGQSDRIVFPNSTPIATGSYRRMK